MTIKQWLNSNRNYDIGVALYASFGTDALLKKMFDQGKSTIREKRLFEELLQLKDTDNFYKPDARKEPNNINIASIEMPEQNAEPEKDIYREQWMPYYQEMNILRHSLETIPGDQQRGKAAFRILELEQICMSIWAKRDYYIKNGSKIKEEQEENLDPFADLNSIQRRINTVRTYITKYSKPPYSDKKTLQLQKYQIELAILIEEYNKLQ